MSAYETGILLFCILSMSICAITLIMILHNIFTSNNEVPLVVKFKKLNKDAIIPTYAHPTDAGMDLYAIEDVDLLYQSPKIVKTGLAMELPAGTEAQIRSRSSLAAKHGVMVLNSPGTIDQNYRGEVGVIMMATNHSYHISKGDKIAQMVICELPEVETLQVISLSDTDRGTGGFGSTGK